MSEWTKVRLGNGLRVHHGFAFKGEFFAPAGKQIVLTPGNFVESGGFKPKNGTEKYYLGPVPEKFLLRKGDVVIAMTEQAQGLLGSTATIPEDGIYLHNQRIGLLEITDPELLDLRFVYHLMNSSDVRRQVQATATGSKVRHTAPERVHAVTALVPSLAEQRAVAEILDTIDDLIENNRRRVRVLEEMARAIYREWFVKFRYPGHQSVPLVRSALGPIPEQWLAGRLGDLADEVRESVKPGDLTRSVPYVPIDEIDARSLTLHRSRPGEDAASSLRAFREGDVLFGAMRAYFHKVCLAPFDGVTRSTCFVLRPRADWGVLPLLYLDDDETIAYASNHSSGSTIPYAKWDGVLSQRKVAIPPLSLAKEYSEAARPMLLEARSLSRQAGELAAIRDLLLPKLVTGQIDVSALDLDLVLEEALT